VLEFLLSIFFFFLVAMCSLSILDRTRALVLISCSIVIVVLKKFDHNGCLGKTINCRGGLPKLLAFVLFSIVTSQCVVENHEEPGASLPAASPHVLFPKEEGYFLYFSFGPQSEIF
jgi:hypothetical protein